MFELKYKIAKSDVERINKSLMWKYFIPYVIVAIAGIVTGIIAIVKLPVTHMVVLGVILTVLGAGLLVCAILLLIAPKNFVASALLADEEKERNVIVSDDGITVKTEGQSDIIFSFGEIRKVQTKPDVLYAYIGSEQVLIVKNAFVSEGGTLSALAEFLIAKIKGVKNVEDKPEQAEEKLERAEEKAEEEKPAEETAEEKTAEEQPEKAEETAEEQPEQAEESSDEQSEKPADGGVSEEEKE